MCVPLSINSKVMKKHLIRLAVSAAIALVAVIVVCNILVVSAASGKTYDTMESIPHNRYGLLLATSPITQNGTRNNMFHFRVDAAESLLKAGKIDYLIASGGNYADTERNGCDEPAAIRDSLISRGIDPQRIITDYDGTRTQNSIIKAKEGYGLDSVTIISQEYHNGRALYLADKYGLEAVAFNAKPTPRRSTRLKNNIREWFARVKLFIDLSTDNQPTYPPVQTAP